MKTSEVFKLAKQHLSTTGDWFAPGSSYICIAIENSTQDNDWDAGEKARAIVQQRLGEYYTFEDWLHKEHGIHRGPYVKAGTVRQFRDKVQATRHAWLDSMIQEFAAQGD